MKELDEKGYRPPFVTETDEPVWDDCTVCATLMAVASATLGEAVSRQNWSELSPKQLKFLREKIRNHLPADKQTGGTSMADMRVAFGKEYPYLPEIPFYDEQDRTWEEFMQTLLDRTHVYVVQGNPALVKNTSSRLRRWTNYDNFGHAIYADHARVRNGKRQIFIMDPLGRGSYKGEYVPENELKQFTWTFGNGRFVKASGFPRGDWSIGGRRAARLIDKIKVVRDDLSESQRTVATLSERAQDILQDLTQVSADLAASEAQRINAEAAREEAEAMLADERVAYAAALAECRSASSEQIANLEEEIANLEDDISELEAERTGALERAAIEQGRADAEATRADTAEAATATCQDIVVRKDAVLKKRLALIKSLRKQLEQCGQ